MSRIKYNVNDLLNDINGTLNGIGEDLTYTDFYDNIKNARFEEDNTLSQGVWSRDLQVPNWELVESLSVEAIQNKSKDLQIIGWLIESLVVLDKFEGISKGICILNEFIKKYWDICYPLLPDNNTNIEQNLVLPKRNISNTNQEQNDNSEVNHNLTNSIDNSSDVSQSSMISHNNQSNVNQRLTISQSNISDVNQKVRILEWIYETVYRRFNLIDLFGENSFSLYNYEYAIAINTSIIQNPNNKAQIIESARKSNIKFIEDINNIIENIDQSEIDKLYISINEINQNISDLKITLLEKNNTDRAFTKLHNNIKILEKLLSKRNNNMKGNNNNIIVGNTNIANNNIKEKEQIIENKNSLKIKSLNREEIYKLLNELYLLLKEVDKHSPSPYLLNLILEWKDKTLLEIINDVKIGNTESHQLLKMLLS
ncbi:MAG: type VI secretion system ImpA family N-terminal domain-containing protein [Alphaproteobacteria bacterium]|nr:type VI secretion system ImpA family N-terminal domain-containing protein [Alphaproteobacteria bacterium]